MGVLSWASADLLSRAKFFALRPSTDAEISDVQWYDLLSLAQEHWYQTFSVHVPEVLYGAPAKLTTADSGKTYTFPNSVHPLGPVEVRESLDKQLLVASTDWDARGDYVHEGDLIRMPNNEERTFADGPYARFITPPDVISASVEPTLNPPRARILVVHRACVMWASRGGVRDPAAFEALEMKAWIGDPAMDGDVGIMGELKRQFFTDSMISSPTSVRPWTRGSFA